jgi:RHS repeat-associated protein
MADVVTANDYYPGGMDMPGRQYNAATGYRYGFNGKEEDKESPVQYDYGFRIYDPRLVRFKSVDPLIKKYPELTPYQFASNRPIDGVDLDGLEYVKRIHYVGYVDSKLQITHTKDIMYYQMDNKMILAHGGTPAGSYNAAAYGPEGKGIKHEYYFEDGIEALKPRWDSRQNDTRGEIAFHGLYSGPGSITKGGINSTNYDFSFKPIDASDAIAKRHDMNYSKDASNNYQGFIEDTRTLAADNQMVKEVQAFLFVNSPLNLKPTNAPTPAGETMASAASQLTMIGALARYKTWKIERMESLGLNKNNTDHMQDSRVTLENYKVSWFKALISPKAAVQRATYQLLKASK